MPSNICCLCILAAARMFSGGVLEGRLCRFFFLLKCSMKHLFLYKESPHVASVLLSFKA